MNITIGAWIISGIVFLCGVGISAYIYYETGWDKNPKGAIINMIVTIILTIALLASFNWYYSSTASGKRSYKDFQSELHENIYREIVITAEDGREIFRFEGRFDVERHADGDDRYIRFESEDGKRYTISYGVQDTVLIIEKDKVGE